MSSEIKAIDRLMIARNAERPGTKDIIDALFTDFFEQKGDRNCKEDESILGGIALFKGMPVTVIGHRKGRNLQENLRFNFGMSGPEGYRKAKRIMAQAEKFRRPIITFIDTPGAYPGIEAEARGQGEAIAQSIAFMSSLTVPVIAVIIGEGCSGGALALAVGNVVMMLENATYSVLSPEGFAAILWKDSSRSGEACDIMKLTAHDLREAGICDQVIKEGEGGAHLNKEITLANLERALKFSLNALSKESARTLSEQKYRKYRTIGNKFGGK